MKYLPSIVTPFGKHAIWTTQHRVHFRKGLLPLVQLDLILIHHLCCIHGLFSSIRTWAQSLLAALAVWVPFSFIPLIVEQFWHIDKLQVWSSEGGKGQLRVNGSALGYEAHLDSFIRQSYVVFMGSQKRIGVSWLLIMTLDEHIKIILIDNIILVELFT